MLTLIDSTCPKISQILEASGLKNPAEYGENIGISAQELQQIIPEAISTRSVTLQDGTVMEDALELTKADAMWFALINAVKELDDRNEQLTARAGGQQDMIDQLKMNNEVLSERVTDLEQRIEQVDELKEELAEIRALLGASSSSADRN